jgi:hypothetical protein
MILKLTFFSFFPLYHLVINFKKYFLWKILEKNKNYRIKWSLQNMDILRSLNIFIIYILKNPYFYLKCYRPQKYRVPKTWVIFTLNGYKQKVHMWLWTLGIFLKSTFDWILVVFGQVLKKLHCAFKIYAIIFVKPRKFDIATFIKVHCSLLLFKCCLGLNSRKKAISRFGSKVNSGKTMDLQSKYLRTWLKV